MQRQGEPSQPEPAKACSRAVGLRMSAACSGATLTLHSYSASRMDPYNLATDTILGTVLGNLADFQASVLKDSHSGPHDKIGGAWHSQGLA